MRKIPLLVLAVLTLTVAGCTWGIKLNEGGKKVHTAWTQDVSQCKQLGRVTVSVMDRVGPIDRNDIKVRDELEVMARNEAASMGADTVKPLGEPLDGEQAWGAYQCGQAAMKPAAATTGTSAQPQDGSAQTYPVEGN
ncbi:DUF4156 domain-containing protein [Oleiagrimonas soli]|uniref:DUF4156 domain-containing protein n=1 Tax=Oleiagrimonas soli TaxID=1543381 RepID=A0A099D1D0_9GAMM|nr:DUF4156 domain-containing protein [Oleiagrimonas soli]KGI79095.1 hypothetical protein LF63_0100995 [Oleiagrimonas soli]MBB6184693.1 hypothetical protein [Oleiagrimonas soli]